MGGGNGSSLANIGGIAPRSCTDFFGVYNDSNNTIEFHWTNIICDFWGGVRLVVKKNTIPENYSDGDIIKDFYNIDGYVDSAFILSLDDIDLSGANEMYCVLFPFSTTYVMNITMANTVRVKIEHKKSFSECTWEEINGICESGEYKTRFNIGDTKTVEATDGNTYTMRIVAFDVNDKSDGSGKASIHLMSDEMYSEQATVSYGYADNAYWNMITCLPSDLQSVIKEVNYNYKTGTLSDTGSLRTAENKKTIIPHKYVMIPDSGITTYYTGKSNEDRQKVTIDGTDMSWYPLLPSDITRPYHYDGASGNKYTGINAKTGEEEYRSYNSDSAVGMIFVFNI